MYSAIDTLQITKRLQSKGAEVELAEEFAEIIKEREQHSIANLATKNDLKIAKRDILIAVGVMNFAVAIAIINFVGKLSN